MPFDPDRPLAVGEAKQLIAAILATTDRGGSDSFTHHALRELRNDKMTTLDVLNVLRRGVVREPEWENGTLRYRVETRGR